jgi:hypothetical protein
MSTLFMLIRVPTAGWDRQNRADGQSRRPIRSQGASTDTVKMFSLIYMHYSSLILSLRLGLNPRIVSHSLARAKSASVDATILLLSTLYF